MRGDNKINLMVLIVSMPVGGVETQLISIIPRLNKDKYNITICCIRDLDELGRKAADMGIRTIALNLMKSSRFSLNIPYQISRIIKENNIHILWTHQYVANLYGRMAALLVRTPVISTFRALYDTPKLHRSIFNHLLSYKTDVLVAISKAVAYDMKRFDRISSEKIKVIYNGIELSLFDTEMPQSKCREKLGLPENDIIVGTVGRLSVEKNHKIIVDALNRLPANIKGVVIGDGHLRKILEEAGGDRFYFLGQMQYNLIPLALKAMDIFCFPSLWEGFGTVLIEAMASGLPIVASDIPPHREVIEDAGILISPQDPDLLAKTIQVLIDDFSLRNRLVEKAKERAQTFSIENTVEAYNNLFEETIKKRDN